MAQSRFFRNAAQFTFRYAEQEGCSGLGHEFWDLIRQIVHGLPTICTPALASLMTAGSTVYLSSVLRGKPFFHQLQKTELVRLRDLSSSVLGVNEVGAQSTEAARSRNGKIAFRQITTIRKILHFQTR